MRTENSKTELTTSDLLGELCELLDEEFESCSEAPPFHEWVKGITLDGRPFSYENHEYLIDPYRDTHPHQVEMKAAQLGLTTKAMLRSFYSLRHAEYKGVLYLFPSRTDVLDFSKSRITPLLEENPEIQDWIRDTDSAGLKRVWNGSLYLRGMVSRVGLKSIPVDFTVFDELDEAPPKMVDMAVERMAHSEFKHILKLSNPTLPDYGIDLAFQETDQRYWMLKCRFCNNWTCLPLEFPQGLIENPNGEVIRVCTRCKGRLDISKGQWVAQKPSITDKRGYQYSQLFSHYVDPKDILHQFRTTNNLTDFYNLKIGLAYVEAHNRLSVEQVLDLCGTEGIVSESKGPCFMGIDQGSDLHVVIGQKHPQKAGKIVHMEVYKDWEELGPLMKRFNVLRAVVDALPETRNARAFAKRHEGKVYLNYYNEHQKGSYAWNEKELIVSCNRTESLDASHNEVMKGELILPKRCQIVEEFAQHLHHAAKKLEEDEETGSKRYIYVRVGGDDHFRHAYNYEAMARQNSPKLLFAQYLN